MNSGESMPKGRETKNDNSAKFGFEEKLWVAADTLCDNLLPKLLSGELWGKVATERLNE